MPAPAVLLPPSTVPHLLPLFYYHHYTIHTPFNYRFYTLFGTFGAGTVGQWDYYLGPYALLLPSLLCLPCAPCLAILPLPLPSCSLILCYACCCSLRHLGGSQSVSSEQAVEEICSVSVCQCPCRVVSIDKVSAACLLPSPSQTASPW